MAVPERLRAGDLTPLWTELHRRFSTGAQVSRVTVRGLNAGQRTALADLLGMDRYPGESLTLAISALDVVMKELTGSDARTVTEEICGSIGDRARDRRERQRERETLWCWLEQHPAVAAEPALLVWAQEVRRQGLVNGSIAVTRALLENVLKVLTALPADGRPLPAFANDLLGDTHALDDGGRLSGIVLRALAAVHEQPPPNDAQERRALWERAGVECDALSTTVVVAGLRPTGADVLSCTLRMWADAGQACVVTLQQLRYGPDTLVSAPNVWVVENPTIVALAVRRFGHRCPPLICSSGWPSTAVVHLLRAITRSGATLHYHGDLDGEGLRIAAHVMAKTGALPWRMSSDDYYAALGGATRHYPEPGRISEAPWDPDLARNLETRNAAVLEEEVADTLLADLEAVIEESPSL
ncbi:TIGR02679 family protein [Actinomadura litoris]|uniref:TIGR02679 family protein n=1 Tax=Actinomadura litoris TaxID=2678616 RepID=UPI001FA78304|nr:TIGR02679 family protein [Actinomadura litoris]